jgi:hypothetical protein
MSVLLAFGIGIGVGAVLVIVLSLCLGTDEWLEEDLREAIDAQRSPVQGHDATLGQGHGLAGETEAMQEKEAKVR